MSQVDVEILKSVLSLDFSISAYSVCSCGRPTIHCTPDVKDVPYKK